ncbi:TyeA family type III secretion system gatekeeper subunit [Pseudomonas hefeiensis]|uniref:TyeA family type III secretion system gatekeeper subunit n=1 Tax=Pseudomonas hefeiensis TaxID=2738125 RepID=A0ABY9GA52_9PSED|nr:MULTISPECIES: TyeA family type III secretion system gatekeeper subunit [unclassified Pseudomonas]WLH12494.1 TyeA family type III secretion system gatekeeper subunit [Pseudomonas sp. FP205]WLH95549.1 TyeA family type III secretion system gatekeeper subunit [Pseudomonas sp. FP53]WLI39831.1 TyeA family type III secretion system gatekeeper subunit [Pseudomonas sp. FP821]
MAIMKVEAPTNAHIAVNLAQAASAMVGMGKPVASAQSVQSNSMEEVGMTFSHHVERNTKALSQRRIRNARSEVGQVRVETREQLEQWYDQLGHPGKQSLGAMAAQAGLLLCGEPVLEEVVQSTGGDPARTDLILQQALRDAQVQGRLVEAQRARDYLQLLRERYGAQIQAGMNIAEALRASGGDPELRQAVRRLYYDTVVLKQSLPTMMQALLGLFGEAAFVPGLDMMRRALADDIAAHTPSRPTALLRTLLIGLAASTQLGSVLHSCRRLLEQLAYSCPASQLTAVLLLQRMLGFVSSGLSAAEVRRIGRELGGEEERDQLVSLNGLYPLLKRLPLPLWRDGKSRQTALKNLLVLLDERSRDDPRCQTAAPVIGARS